jgi:hypothetical protein
VLLLLYGCLSEQSMAIDLEKFWISGGKLGIE